MTLAELEEEQAMADDLREWIAALRADIVGLRADIKEMATRHDLDETEKRLANRIGAVEDDNKALHRSQQQWKDWIIRTIVGAVLLALAYAWLADLGFQGR